MLRSSILVLAASACLANAAAPAAAPAGAVQAVAIEASRQHGLDMFVVDGDAMPPEPELAADLPQMEDEPWTGAPVDLMKPVHPVYTELRRLLVRYQLKWGALPQVRVPTTGPLMAVGSTDRRIAVLRHRLGLAPGDAFDQTLRAKLAEYQQVHGLRADGKAGRDTLTSLNKGAAHYQRVILLNMERARRLPVPGAAGKHIVVDAGAARLWMYEGDRAVGSMKVVVGAPDSETPMMAALLRYASVNPYWNVPPDLVRKLIAPRVLAEGISYLKERGYEVLDGWYDNAKLLDPARVDWRAVADGREELRVRQLPGGTNSMGEIKFMMPNEYGIYLHDTPNKASFGSDELWISNGCVRVEDARRLAGWLFGKMPATSGQRPETRVDLAQHIPVYITYMTVGSGRGDAAFLADPYRRDEPLLARFDGDGDGMSDADEAALRPPLPSLQKAAAPPIPPSKGATPQATAVRAPLRKPAGAPVPARTAAVAVEPVPKGKRKATQ
ncbi:MAG TPA: L,D-transpeptidase family protein [Allosphingosinicella sp.]|nr:L,D-transpeptidase family protein [Allosphingosinicella sp.]